MKEGPFEYYPVEYVHRDTYCEMGFYLQDRRIVWASRGTDESVYMDCPDGLPFGMIFAHNHPNEGMDYGVPPSPGDILSAYSLHEKETRVSTPSTLYSLRPLDGDVFRGDLQKVREAMIEEAMVLFKCDRDTAIDWLCLNDDSLRCRIDKFLAGLFGGATKQRKVSSRRAVRQQEEWVDRVADRLGLEFRVWRWGERPP